MTYKETLREAMKMLAQHPKTIFVGQNLIYGGQAMFSTFENIPMDKRVEFPVAEDFQMGYCTGLALEGFIPVSIYPRFDFLLLAANQLVNHLDKIAQMSGYNPKVIIRTAVGSSKPLNPGLQHTMNHSEAFRKLLSRIHVVELLHTDSILRAYEDALKCDGSVIIVEHGNLYHGN